MAPPPPPPTLQIANVAPLGFCCVFDYIQLFLSAGLEECFGFTPCHQLLSQARRNIKAASKEKATVGGWWEGGWGGAARVMSRWTERRAGEPVTWLMADLPLHWRGEASQARPLPLPLPLPSSHDTHTHFIDTYPFLRAASAVVCAGADIRNFLQSGLHPQPDSSTCIDSPSNLAPLMGSPNRLSLSMFFLTFISFSYYFRLGQLSEPVCSAGIDMLPMCVESKMFNGAGFLHIHHF